MLINASFSLYLTALAMMGTGLVKRTRANRPGRFNVRQFIRGRLLVESGYLVLLMGCAALAAAHGM